MAHDHGHSHGGDGHGHAPAGFGRALAIGIALTTAFVVIEATFGILAHSLALVADAGHNLSDVLGLFLAWGASVLVRRRRTARRTYGLLIAIKAIAWEAAGRFAHPQPVAGGTVIAERSPVAREDHPPTTPGRPGFPAQQGPGGQEVAGDDDGKARDAEEETAPGEDGLEQHPGRGTERYPPGHRAEEHAQGPSPLAEGEQVADEGERERPDATGTEAREQAEHRHGRERPGGGDGGEQDKGQAGREDDAAPPEAIGQGSGDERGRAVGEEVGGHNEPHRPDRDVEEVRQARRQRRDHEGLEEDQEGGPAEDP